VKYLLHLIRLRVKASRLWLRASWPFMIKPRDRRELGRSLGRGIWKKAPALARCRAGR